MSNRNSRKIITKRTGVSKMETNYYKVGAMQGWQCPICKRVLAPFVQECPCKGQEIKNYTTVSTLSEDSKTITIHD